MRGSVIKKGSAYYVVVDAGRSTAGKRQQKWISAGQNKKAAESKLIEVMRQLETGVTFDAARMTTREYLEQWLTHVQTSKRPNTYRGYESKVRAWLLPGLGDVPLRKLNPARIADFYTRTLNGPRLHGPGSPSKSTVHHLHRLLNVALEQAVRWKMLAYNPAKGAAPSRGDKPTIRPLLAEEIPMFLSACEGHRWGLLYHLILHSGMRRSEALALRWSRVNFETGTVKVIEGLHTLPNVGPVFTGTKTVDSQREISLDPDTLLMLRAHREKQQAEWATLGTDWNDGALMFCDENTRPLSPNAVSMAFKHILLKAGLPTQIRLHDLRHAHASILFEAGVQTKAVSSRLGHSSTKITEDIYLHVRKAVDQASADAFAATVRKHKDATVVRSGR